MKKTGEISINRKHLFWIGFTVIVLIALTNRLNFILKSNFTQGVVVSIKKLSVDGKIDETNTVPVIRFVANGNTFYFDALKNSHYKYGETVRVVYHKSNPAKAKIFGFEDFIYPVLLYCIVPIMILGAAVFSFIKPKDKLLINLKKIFFINRVNKDMEG
ncbi:MAG TPA: DUF3592 domain-containing protein [Bacteroidales bacterium]|nr:DUF3592 domain-containing protein [Bacteroidales bacterium]